MANAARLREGLAALGVTVFGGVDAPYVWLKTPDGVTSWEFFDRLLATAHVVGTPGSGFGPSGEGYFRLSAFNSRENVEEALSRLRRKFWLNKAVKSGRLGTPVRSLPNAGRSVSFFLRHPAMIEGRALRDCPSGEKRPMQVVLEPINGKGLKIPIDKAIIFIGRHPDCDIVITRSRTISRKHCAIVQVNDSLVMRDLGSTNGVRVNGKRVQKEARFTAGDTVTFGDIEYNVRKIKAIEPEKRANRDHPQDARAGGAIPLRAEVAVRGRQPGSARRHSG